MRKGHGERHPLTLRKVQGEGIRRHVAWDTWEIRWG
jgi:hypothetical protein